MTLTHTVVLAKITGKTRSAAFMGRTFLVAPATMVRSQVLLNNLGATYLPPEEITDEWAAQWNGAPVVVQAHPTVHGVAISARRPDILSAQGAGWVFEARTVTLEDGTRELKGEVWLDPSRADEVPELAGILARLQQNEAVELSTGFPVLLLNSPGTVDGQPFEYTLQPMGADHLAIFLEKTGACSVQDGCGLGINQQQPGVASMQINTEPASPPPAARGKFLGAVDRVLALLTSTTDDLTQRALVLKRLRAHGLTAAEIGAAANVAPEVVAQWDAGTEPISAEAAAVLQQLAIQRLAENANGTLSDEEKRERLWKGVRAAFGGPNVDIWLEAVFGDTSELVYSVMSMEPMDRAGPSTSAMTEPKMFRTTYELQKDGSVTFGEKQQPVIRRIIYEPAKAGSRNTSTLNLGEDPMKAETQNNTTTPCGGAAAANTDPAPAAAAPVEPPFKGVSEETFTAAITELKNLITSQGTAITSLQAAAQPAIEEQAREREDLLAELTGNARVPYTKEELGVKPLPELRKLAALARGDANYVGRGGPRAASNTSTEPEFMAPAPYFAEQKAQVSS